ncbi:hypothetical protein Bhyg_04703 [Pseudolycoriella hygida]|uniref:Mutator-like transposase domain-containing protein n=1 Tax=Pseudolycoriella hygida TaxID=35572 RepID=A0A9Q0NGG7_9DIPT|nr:hypothetical protein Bhyg_04703 [Pseudolycoriella hygida]
MTTVGPQIDDEWDKLYFEFDNDAVKADANSDYQQLQDSFDPQIGEESDTIYIDREDNSADKNVETCTRSGDNLNQVTISPQIDGELERINFDHDDTNADVTSNARSRNEAELTQDGNSTSFNASDLRNKNDAYVMNVCEERPVKDSSSRFVVDICIPLQSLRNDHKNRNRKKEKAAIGINGDAVLGITSVGLGYSHVEEICANLGVSCMSYSLFRKEEKIQQEDWFEAAKSAALESLKKEIELAKANGEVDSKGNALIRVITDGSWGKRSYGRNFSSLSGFAVIIGLRTNKAIYFDTRNRYCHTCKVVEVRGEQVKQHKCNKNYDGPPTGMESDIILTGFKECDILGARFNILISDGDSNTYKLIKDLRVYKDPDVFVIKLECVNHLFRNFYKKFNDLSKIKLFDADWRKKFITPSFCLNMFKGIRMAARHWRESNESLPMKIRLLEKDILNAPAHYIGYHANCSSYFCQKASVAGTVETVNALKNDGIYYEVQSLCQTYFGNNARSLLANYTNNPAEQFNGYVAKYLGGKRINYSLAGSYASRVAMAVVHFNTDCHASSEYHRIKLGGVCDLPSVTQLENKRKRKCLENAVARTKKPRVRRAESDKGKAYGGVRR